MSEFDRPKFVTNCMPLFVVGTFATVAVAYHDPSHAPVKLDDYGHPESPGAPNRRVSEMHVAAISSASAGVTISPIFAWTGK